MGGAGRRGKKKGHLMFRNMSILSAQPLYILTACNICERGNSIGVGLRAPQQAKARRTCVSISGGCTALLHEVYCTLHAYFRVFGQRSRAPKWRSTPGVKYRQCPEITRRALRAARQRGCQWYVAPQQRPVTVRTPLWNFQTPVVSTGAPSQRTATLFFTGFLGGAACLPASASIAANGASSVCM